MELLSEEVGFIGEQDVSTFDLAEVETLSGDFVRCCHDRIGEGTNEISKVLSLVNNVLNSTLLLRLEGQAGYLRLPILKVFELRSSCITRYLDSMVTDWTGVFVLLLQFATRDFQAFPMIPIGLSAKHNQIEIEKCFTIRDKVRTLSSCQPRADGRYRRHP